MKYFVEQWRSDFDYIIIDSPPMGAVIDAKVLATLADKVIFVVRWRETERQMVAHNVAYLANIEKLAGVALNMVDEAKISRYGGSARHSGHYYKKYYDN
jgi:Mrp family chromosome partitioning ATPase